MGRRGWDLVLWDLLSSGELELSICSLACVLEVVGWDNTTVTAWPMPKFLRPSCCE